jgi:NADH-quinone oxidoreductase subunit N
MSYILLDYWYLIISLALISIYGITVMYMSINSYKLTALAFVYNGILKLNLSVWELEGDLLSKILIIVSILLAGYLLLPLGMPNNPCIRFEVPLLIILCVYAMMTMAEATDFVELFLALELQAFIFYTLVGIKKESIYEVEGALKYFLLGSCASFAFIFGVSYLYAYSGFTDIQIIYDIASMEIRYQPNLFNAGTSLIICALLFKIGSVPFHLWLPDAYQAADNYFLLFFIVFPKIFLFYTIFRLNQLFEFYAQQSNIVLISLILTAIVGSLQAVSQIKIKRFIAYTVIFNNAFFIALMFLSDYFALFSLISALLVYMCVSILTILPLLSIRTINNNAFSALADFMILRKANLYLAFTIMIAFFSAAGMPPFIGFFLKFFVFFALLEKGFLLLSVFLILASLLPAYYYIRITSILFFFPRTKILFLYPIPPFLTHSLSLFLSLTVGFLLQPSFLIILTY